MKKFLIALGIVVMVIILAYNFGYDKQIDGGIDWVERFLVTTWDGVIDWIGKFFETTWDGVRGALNVIKDKLNGTKEIVEGQFVK